MTIEDQPSDQKTVIVDSVTVPEGGFVAIHDESFDADEEEHIDSIIGVSLYLEPGTHENVPVTVSPELDTASDIEVTAVAYQDTNDNQVFDFVESDGNTDSPYTTGQVTETETATATETETATATETATVTETMTPGFTATETPAGQETGDLVSDSAEIDTTSDEGPAMNLEVENQSSNGTTITVDQVTLYRGGYLVVHDSTLEEDGEEIDSVIGHSAYLEPGMHEDVTITLSESIDFSNEGDATVTVMPHNETNQNLVFDFVISSGQEDLPYMSNGSAVTATITVTEEGATGTATAEPTETATAEPTETATAEPTETATETPAGV